MPLINRVKTCAFIISLSLTASQLHAEECTPSKWGADDQIGSANMVTPENTLRAAKLIKKGASHPLGIVIDPDMPAFLPRKMMLQVVQPNQQNGRSLLQDFGWDAVYNDDLAQLWWGIGPQLDGLGHMGESAEYYNCNKATDISQVTGLTRLGIHGVPPMVSRGVLINMAKHFGVESMSGGQGISRNDLKAAMKAQKIKLRDGDVILLHTGWTEAKLEAAPQEWVSTEPGLNNDAAVFLAEQNPMAVGADTWGLEAIPPAPGDKQFYGHVTMLKHHGIYILETMNTGRLAEEGVSEFMFVLGQARLKGAVQMMINPVAMW
ncbi:MAG: cyclase family protein [Pseudomonadales bacterium]